MEKRKYKRAMLSGTSKMVAMKTRGASLREISEATGLSPMGVWTRLSKPELKNLIEKKQMQYLERNVDKSLGGLTELIHAPRKSLESDDKKMQYDAWMKTAQAVGVYPSNQTSVVVEKLNQINIFQQPQLKEAMGNFVKFLAGPEKNEEGEVVDADVGSPS